MGTIPPSALRRCGIALAALALAATACTPSEEGGAPGGDTASQDAVITIAPETGAEAVAPDTPVTVTAEQGTLTGVTVDQVVPDQPEDQASPFEMTGTLSEDGTSWVADWSLAPGAAVTVTATADNAEGGGTTELVHEFTTADAVEGQRLELSHNFPTSGETVGVGMPITIGFDLPVTEKAAVESALKVVSEQGVAGSWRWLDDKTAVFRPETYWEPYQEVSVEMHLAGVRAAEGVYGVRDHRLTFEVGRELRLNMNVPDHEMVVTVDGEETRTIPVSNGDGTSNFSTTSSGTHVLMERYEELLMDSDTVELPAGRDGYSTEVQYAVRTSNSGEFLHEASYNSNIGSANTSNGCTNMRMDDAKWIFENTLMGDVLDTTGTDRVKEWHNGWGYWQLSWDEWLAESATGEPQVTDGSNPPGSPFGQPAGDSEEE